jgi:hypothetical protein
MILYFVLVGFVAGALGAVVVLSAGGGILFAILAYSLAGALGVVLTAVFMAVMPTIPRPRPRGGLPVDARRVRVQAHARR